MPLRGAVPLESLRFLISSSHQKQNQDIFFVFFFLFWAYSKNEIGAWMLAIVLAVAVAVVASFSFMLTDFNEIRLIFMLTSGHRQASSAPDADFTFLRLLIHQVERLTI